MHSKPFYSSKLSQIWVAIVVILIQFHSLRSQENRKVSLFYNWFDEKIGIENSGLYNGFIYTNNFNVINEKHQFFNSSALSLGSVTYNGQTYYGQKLKYDLFNDEVLITPKNKTSALLIVLQSTRTDGFSIEGHPFIRVDNTIEGSSKQLGYCEIIAKNDTLVLVKKYRKQKIDKRETKTVYHEFKQDADFFVSRGGMFYPINSRRDWVSVFPDYKNAIKTYYREYRELKKTNMDTFMRFALENLFSFKQGKKNSF